MLGLDVTSRLIGGGLSDRLSSLSKGLSGVLHVIDCSSTMTPSRVATHGQQVAPLGESYPSAEVESVHSNASADRAVLLWV